MAAIIFFILVSWPIALDFFVTNYSKQKEVVYWLNEQYKICDHNPVRKFQVHMEYKSQLKSFTKHLMDPFRRRDRISFMISTVRIETTVAQLNFFRWAFDNGILLYVQAHIAEIEAEMTPAATSVTAAAASTNEKGTTIKKNEPVIHKTHTLQHPYRISFE